MDKLGNARRWAARAAVYSEDLTRSEEALVDVIRAVEMLAMERENKPAAASVGYGALPTAQEIVDVWSKVSGIIVEHRAMLAVEMVRARVMPELAARDKRIAELEKQRDEEHGLSNLRSYEIDTWKTRLAEAREKIAELEKRLSEATTPLTVDGKTPGQVYGDAFRSVPLQVSSQDATEYAAQAVLRAFGPDFARAALLRVRESVERNPHDHEEVLAFIDAEIASLEAPKPTSDHVHELGSCSFCDKRPTGQEFVLACKARLLKAGVNITVESPIHWGVIDDVVGELFEQWRAEASPK